jgi:hypothetical protein
MKIDAAKLDQIQFYLFAKKPTCNYPIGPNHWTVLSDSPCITIPWLWDEWEREFGTLVRK